MERGVTLDNLDVDARRDPRIAIPERDSTGQRQVGADDQIISEIVSGDGGAPSNPGGDGGIRTLGTSKPRTAV